MCFRLFFNTVRHVVSNCAHTLAIILAWICTYLCLSFAQTVLQGVRSSGTHVTPGSRKVKRRSQVRATGKSSDSEDGAQFSDDSLKSGTNSHNSSRPGSGSSRRRRRPTPRHGSNEAPAKRRRAGSSGEGDYAASESDGSVYSVDSLTSRDNNAKGKTAETLPGTDGISEKPELKSLFSSKEQHLPERTVLVQEDVERVVLSPDQKSLETCPSVELGVPGIIEIQDIESNVVDIDKAVEQKAENEPFVTEAGDTDEGIVSSEIQRFAVSAFTPAGTTNMSFRAHFGATKKPPVTEGNTNTRHFQKPVIAGKITLSQISLWSGGSNSKECDDNFDKSTPCAFSVLGEQQPNLSRAPAIRRFNIQRLSLREPEIWSNSSFLPDIDSISHNRDTQTPEKPLSKVTRKRSHPKDDESVYQQQEKLRGLHSKYGLLEADMEDEEDDDIRGEEDDEKMIEEAVIEKSVDRRPAFSLHHDIVTAAISIDTEQEGDKCVQGSNISDAGRNDSDSLKKSDRLITTAPASFSSEGETHLATQKMIEAPLAIVVRGETSSASSGVGMSSPEGRSVSTMQEVDMVDFGFADSGDLPGHNPATDISNIVSPALTVSSGHYSTISAGQDTNQTLDSTRADIFHSISESVVSAQNINDESSGTLEDYHTPLQSPRISDDCMVRKESVTFLPPTYSHTLPSRSPNLQKDRPVSPRISITAKARHIGSAVDPQNVLVITDETVRQALREEVEKKLSRLERRIRSLSDSAISSDYYTDPDSCSVSPRSSRFRDLSVPSPHSPLKAQHADYSFVSHVTESMDEQKQQDRIPYTLPSTAHRVGDLKRPESVEYPYHVPVPDSSQGRFPERLVNAILTIQEYPLFISPSLRRLQRRRIKGRLTRSMDDIRDLEKALQNQELKKDFRKSYQGVHQDEVSFRHVVPRYVSKQSSPIIPGLVHDRFNVSSPEILIQHTKEGTVVEAKLDQKFRDIMASQGRAKLLAEQEDDSVFSSVTKYTEIGPFYRTPMGKDDTLRSPSSHPKDRVTNLQSHHTQLQAKADVYDLGCLSAQDLCLGELCPSQKRIALWKSPSESDVPSHLEQARDETRFQAKLAVMRSASVDYLACPGNDQEEDGERANVCHDQTDSTRSISAAGNKSINYVPGMSQFRPKSYTSSIDSSNGPVSGHLSRSADSLHTSNDSYDSPRYKGYSDSFPLLLDRSASLDNIYYQRLLKLQAKRQALHRSRSAGMVEAGDGEVVQEEPDDQIFPPNVHVTDPDENLLHVNYDSGDNDPELSPYNRSDASFVSTVGFSYRKASHPRDFRGFSEEVRQQLQQITQHVEEAEETEPKTKLALETHDLSPRSASSEYSSDSYFKAAEVESGSPYFKEYNLKSKPMHANQGSHSRSFGSSNNSLQGLEQNWAVHQELSTPLSEGAENWQQVSQLVMETTDLLKQIQAQPPALAPLDLDSSGESLNTETITGRSMNSRDESPRKKVRTRSSDRTKDSTLSHGVPSVQQSDTQQVDDSQESREKQRRNSQLADNITAVMHDLTSQKVKLPLELQQRILEEFLRTQHERELEEHQQQQEQQQQQQQRQQQLEQSDAPHTRQKSQQFSKEPRRSRSCGNYSAILESKEEPLRSESSPPSASDRNGFVSHDQVGNNKENCEIRVMEDRGHERFTNEEIMTDRTDTAESTTQTTPQKSVNRRDKVIIKVRDTMTQTGPSLNNSISEEIQTDLDLSFGSEEDRDDQMHFQERTRALEYGDLTQPRSTQTDGTLISFNSHGAQTVPIEREADFSSDFRWEGKPKQAFVRTQEEETYSYNYVQSHPVANYPDLTELEEDTMKENEANGNTIQLIEAQQASKSTSENRGESQVTGFGGSNFAQSFQNEEVQTDMSLEILPRQMISVALSTDDRPLQNDLVLYPTERLNLRGSHENWVYSDTASPALPLIEINEADEDDTFLSDSFHTCGSNAESDRQRIQTSDPDHESHADTEVQERDAIKDEIELSECDDNGRRSGDLPTLLLKENEEQADEVLEASKSYTSSMMWSTSEDRNEESLSEREGGTSNSLDEAKDKLPLISQVLDTHQADRTDLKLNPESHNTEGESTDSSKRKRKKKRNRRHKKKAETSGHPEEETDSQVSESLLTNGTLYAEVLEKSGDIVSKASFKEPQSDSELKSFSSPVYPSFANQEPTEGNIRESSVFTHASSKGSKMLTPSEQKENQIEENQTSGNLNLGPRDSSSSLLSQQKRSYELGEIQLKRDSNATTHPPKITSSSDSLAESLSSLPPVLLFTDESVFNKASANQTSNSISTKEAEGCNKLSDRGWKRDSNRGEVDSVDAPVSSVDKISDSSSNESELEITTTEIIPLSYVFETVTPEHSTQAVQPFVIGENSQETGDAQQENISPSAYTKNQGGEIKKSQSEFSAYNNAKDQNDFATGPSPLGFAPNEVISAKLEKTTTDAKQSSMSPGFEPAACSEPSVLPETERRAPVPTEEMSQAEDEFISIFDNKLTISEQSENASIEMTDSEVTEAYPTTYQRARMSIEDVAIIVDTEEKHHRNTERNTDNITTFNVEIHSPGQEQNNDIVEKRRLFKADLGCDLKVNGRDSESSNFNPKDSAEISKDNEDSLKEENSYGATLRVAGKRSPSPKQGEKSDSEEEIIVTDIISHYVITKDGDLEQAPATSDPNSLPNQVENQLYKAARNTSTGSQENTTFKEKSVQDFTLPLTRDGAIGEKMIVETSLANDKNDSEKETGAEDAQFSTEVKEINETAKTKLKEDKLFEQTEERDVAEKNIPVVAKASFHDTMPSEDLKVMIRTNKNISEEDETETSATSFPMSDEKTLSPETSVNPDEEVSVAQKKESDSEEEIIVTDVIPYPITKEENSLAQNTFAELFTAEDRSVISTVSVPEGGDGNGGLEEEEKPIISTVPVPVAEEGQIDSEERRVSPSVKSVFTAEDLKNGKEKEKKIIPLPSTKDREFESEQGTAVTSEASAEDREIEYNRDETVISVKAEPLPEDREIEYDQDEIVMSAKAETLPKDREIEYNRDEIVMSAKAETLPEDKEFEYDQDEIVTSVTPEAPAKDTESGSEQERVINSVLSPFSAKDRKMDTRQKNVDMSVISKSPCENRKSDSEKDRRIVNEAADKDRSIDLEDRTKVPFSVSAADAVHGKIESESEKLVIPAESELSRESGKVVYEEKSETSSFMTVPAAKESKTKCEEKKTIPSDISVTSDEDAVDGSLEERKVTSAISEPPTDGRETCAEEDRTVTSALSIPALEHRKSDSKEEISFISAISVLATDESETYAVEDRTEEMAMKSDSHQPFAEKKGSISVIESAVLSGATEAVRRDDIEQNIVQDFEIEQKNESEPEAGDADEIFPVVKEEKSPKGPKHGNSSAPFSVDVKENSSEEEIVTAEVISAPLIQRMDEQEEERTFTYPICRSTITLQESAKHDTPVGRISLSPLKAMESNLDDQRAETGDGSVSESVKEKHSKTEKLTSENMVGSVAAAKPVSAISPPTHSHADTCSTEEPEVMTQVISITVKKKGGDFEEEMTVTDVMSVPVSGKDRGPRKNILEVDEASISDENDGTGTKDKTPTATAQPRSRRESISNQPDEDSIGKTTSPKTKKESDSEEEVTITDIIPLPARQTENTGVRDGVEDIKASASDTEEGEDVEQKPITSNMDLTLSSRNIDDVEQKINSTDFANIAYKESRSETQHEVYQDKAPCPTIDTTSHSEPKSSLTHETENIKLNLKASEEAKIIVIAGVIYKEDSANYKDAVEKGHVDLEKVQLDIDTPSKSWEVEESSAPRQENQSPEEQATLLPTNYISAPSHAFVPDKGFQQHRTMANETAVCNEGEDDEVSPSYNETVNTHHQRKEITSSPPVKESNEFSPLEPTQRRKSQAYNKDVIAQETSLTLDNTQERPKSDVELEAKPKEYDGDDPSPWKTNSGHADEESNQGYPDKGKEKTKSKSLTPINTAQIGVLPESETAQFSLDSSLAQQSSASVEPTRQLDSAKQHMNHQEYLRSTLMPSASSFSIRLRQAVDTEKDTLTIDPSNDSGFLSDDALLSLRSSSEFDTSLVRPGDKSLQMEDNKNTEDDELHGHDLHAEPLATADEMEIRDYTNGEKSGQKGQANQKTTAQQSQQISKPQADGYQSPPDRRQHGASPPPPPPPPHWQQELPQSALDYDMDDEDEKSSSNQQSLQRSVQKRSQNSGNVNSHTVLDQNQQMCSKDGSQFRKVTPREESLSEEATDPTDSQKYQSDSMETSLQQQSQTFPLQNSKENYTPACDTTSYLNINQTHTDEGSPRSASSDEEVVVVDEVFIVPLQPDLHRAGETDSNTLVSRQVQRYHNRSKAQDEQRANNSNTLHVLSESEMGDDKQETDGNNAEVDSKHDQGAEHQLKEQTISDEFLLQVRPAASHRKKKRRKSKQIVEYEMEDEDDDMGVKLECVVLEKKLPECKKSNDRVNGNDICEKENFVRSSEPFGTKTPTADISDERLVEEQVLRAEAMKNRLPFSTSVNPHHSNTVNAQDDVIPREENLPSMVSDNQSTADRLREISHDQDLLAFSESLADELNSSKRSVRPEAEKATEEAYISAGGDSERTGNLNLLCIATSFEPVKVARSQNASETREVESAAALENIESSDSFGRSDEYKSELWESKGIYNFEDDELRDRAKRRRRVRHANDFELDDENSEGFVFDVTATSNGNHPRGFGFFWQTPAATTRGLGSHGYHRANSSQTASLHDYPFELSNPISDELVYPIPGLETTIHDSHENNVDLLDGDKTKNGNSKAPDDKEILELAEAVLISGTRDDDQQDKEVCEELIKQWDEDEALSRNENKSISPEHVSSRDLEILVLADEILRAGDREEDTANTLSPYLIDEWDEEYERGKTKRQEIQNLAEEVARANNEINRATFRESSTQTDISEVNHENGELSFRKEEALEERPSVLYVTNEITMETPEGPKLTLPVESAGTRRSIGMQVCTSKIGPKEGEITFKKEQTELQQKPLLQPPAFTEDGPVLVQKSADQDNFAAEQRTRSASDPPSPRTDDNASLWRPEFHGGRGQVVISAPPASTRHPVTLHHSLSTPALVGSSISLLETDGESNSAPCRTRKRSGRYSSQIRESDSSVDNVDGGARERSPLLRRSHFDGDSANLTISNQQILNEIEKLKSEHSKMMDLLERAKERKKRKESVDTVPGAHSIADTDSSGGDSPITVIAGRGSVGGSNTVSPTSASGSQASSPPTIVGNRPVFDAAADISSRIKIVGVNEDLHLGVKRSLDMQESPRVTTEEKPLQDSTYKENDLPETSAEKPSVDSLATSDDELATRPVDYLSDQYDQDQSFDGDIDDLLLRVPDIPGIGSVAPSTTLLNHAKVTVPKKEPSPSPAIHDYEEASPRRESPSPIEQYDKRTADLIRATTETLSIRTRQDSSGEKWPSLNMDESLSPVSRGSMVSPLTLQAILDDDDEMTDADSAFSTSTTTTNAERHRRHPRNSQAQMVSTGTEVSVDSLDDSTQTDLTDITYDDSTLHTSLLEGAQGGASSDSSGHEMSMVHRELDRLHRERVEIIELLSLQYLPSSLTIELLEAKLNYCIGQTDTLLATLEDSWAVEDGVENKPKRSKVSIKVSQDYLNEYRTEFIQSKKDIESCLEWHQRRQTGVRGRRRTRGRDLRAMKRRAEIEAFKLERLREQCRYERELSKSRRRHLSQGSSSLDDTSASSSFLQVDRDTSFTSSRRRLTPSQRKDHLVSLRRQIVQSTAGEMLDMRNRSMSPRSPPDTYWALQASYSAPQSPARSESPGVGSLGPERYSQARRGSSSSWHAYDHLHYRYGTSPSNSLPDTTHRRLPSVELQQRPHSHEPLLATSWSQKEGQGSSIRTSSLSSDLRTNVMATLSGPDLSADRLIQESNEVRRQNQRQIEKAKEMLRHLDERRTHIRSASQPLQSSQSPRKSHSSETVKENRFLPTATTTPLSSSAEFRMRFSRDLAPGQTSSPRVPLSATASPAMSSFTEYARDHLVRGQRRIDSWSGRHHLPQHQQHGQHHSFLPSSQHYPVSSHSQARDPDHHITHELPRRHVDSLSSVPRNESVDINKGQKHSSSYDRTQAAPSSSSFSGSQHLRSRSLSAGPYSTSSLRPLSLNYPAHRHLQNSIRSGSLYRAADKRPEEPGSSSASSPFRSQSAGQGALSLYHGSRSVPRYSDFYTRPLRSASNPPGTSAAGSASTTRTISDYNSHTYFDPTTGKVTTSYTRGITTKKESLNSDGSETKETNTNPSKVRQTVPQHSRASGDRSVTFTSIPIGTVATRSNGQAPEMTGVTPRSDTPSSVLSTDLSLTAVSSGSGAEATGS
ncbi:kinesin-like protein kif16b [Plakobranchus ocellatus]|uniref:Kinesin-like protein kif16b n=1 Tax=Plakobranchus ocellatus TaxID=259542 RepID=A0AAV4CKN1_9GAST|nr:kinesin-like protein kif16b [Plakobranchus ocellatus]